MHSVILHYFDNKLSEEFVINFSIFVVAILGDLMKYCLQFPKLIHFLIYLLRLTLAVFEELELTGDMHKLVGMLGANMTLRRVGV